MDTKAAQYWKANLRLLVSLLVIWFVVSYGFGIILADALNAIRIGGDDRAAVKACACIFIKRRVDDIAAAIALDDLGRRGRSSRKVHVDEVLCGGQHGRGLEVDRL